MNTYQDYLKMDLSLTVDEMENLYCQMIEEVGNDEIALELYEDLLDQARKYQDYRAKWFSWTREEKMENDPIRSSCHNTLIVKFNVLARFLRSSGKKASWREVLGNEEENPYVRKRIGDFACYMIFIEAISAR